MKATDQQIWSKNLIISNELGLHARAAAKIARLAETAQSKVLIIKDGKEADGADMLDVMSLYCPRGTEVTVRITDSTDQPVLNQIAKLIEAGFGE
jgi:phosphotransferase system HPr (HPr) family protein